ncbi:unnamed protein product [Colias eurytheme]|nr:unnamed protein product [Colias eurytheme]
MSLDAQFNSVAESVRNWKTKPSDNENLALYSLYKQATIGDVNIAAPSVTDVVSSAKFKAWTGRKGMSQDDAKKHEQTSLFVPSSLTKSIARKSPCPSKSNSTQPLRTSRS